MVVYFSCSGRTKKVAEDLNSVVNGFLYEIKPVISYTNEDLDWTNENSRSSLEMKDKSSRPDFIRDLDNIDDYDTIFVGFPIWWYQAPTIINTFLESYDLSHKKVIPFATSGSSDMGNTNKYLADSCKGAILIDGKKFNNPSLDELREWVNSL